MKKEIWKDGVLVETIDKRDLEVERRNRILSVKEDCMERILREVPSYKQNNIALGLYEQEEADLYTSIINKHRNNCKALVERLNNASTLEELDAVI